MSLNQNNQPKQCDCHAGRLPCTCELSDRMNEGAGSAATTFVVAALVTAAAVIWSLLK